MLELFKTFTLNEFGVQVRQLGLAERASQQPPLLAIGQVQKAASNENGGSSHNLRMVTRSQIRSDQITSSAHG